VTEPFSDRLSFDLLEDVSAGPGFFDCNSKRRQR
jgi:hypothetical protein